MKHPPSIVVALLLLFLAAQVIGLFVISNYCPEKAQKCKDLPAGIERPEVEPQYSFILISVAIIGGTIILLFVMKFRFVMMWKLWYLFAVVLSLAIAWTAFIPQLYAGAAAIVAALLKVFRPNFIVHNFTELFIYSGLAAIFVPVMNVFSAAILLFLISLYDMYAVWKSKHMVAMAKFQSSSNLFAGISIPKSLPNFKAPFSAKKLRPSKKAGIPVEERVAIIGGGDIGFPLLFAGVVMAQFGMQKAFIIPVFAVLGLAVLFFISKKGRFYPAMPFISAGCFVGYGVISLF